MVPPYARVLVCTDLSPGAQLALTRAVRLPLARGARLDLVHVIPEVTVSARPVRDAARRALERQQRKLTALARAARRADLVIESRLLAGVPAAELASAAGRLRPGLIVVGRRSRPRARDVLLGSTAARILRRVDAPVLVVAAPARGPYRRVAVALDLERDAPAVAGLAARMPTGRQVVTAIHAFTAPFEGLLYVDQSAQIRDVYCGTVRDEARAQLSKIVARVSVDDITWKTVVKSGSPRSVILRAASAEAAELLVVGTHARGSVGRLFLGSVAEDVVREAPCDVLVCRFAR